MSNTSQSLRATLQEQVQDNCHLSDAAHARDYSLCIYLLKMRELYRWEQGLGFDQPIPKGPLGEWLTAREQLWEEIGERDYQALSIHAGAYLPFDTVAINQHLLPQDLIYSGGLCGSKPHFFLAELLQHQQQDGIEIFISGRELARELTAPPALSLQNRIFLRHESLQRMLWEKLEEWGWQDQERAIARAVRHYPFHQDRQRGLEAMAEMELHTLLQHELGEVIVGRELGEEWEAMLMALPHSRASLQLRAIRDHLVDCRYTLPSLLAEDRQAALHFYMANLSDMRKALFPALAAAYRAWMEGNKRDMMETIQGAQEHWQRLAQQALHTYREDGEDHRKLRQMFKREESELAL